MCVCVYVYICVCIYMYICVCIHIYIYVCVYIYTHTYRERERKRGERVNWGDAGKGYKLPALKINKIWGSNAQHGGYN